VNFKKVIITLLISLAICGTLGTTSATWVAHDGVYFKEGDYVSTAQLWTTVGEKTYFYGKRDVFSPKPQQWKTIGSKTYVYNADKTVFDQYEYSPWSPHDIDWDYMLSYLAKEGYCFCIYYKDKNNVIYVFTDKVMPYKYYERYIKSSPGPDYRVRISVNNNFTKNWF
jgi:hypothetical protein